MAALRVLNLIFLALFVLSIVVQYNDPDPLRWMLVYGAAALTCILAIAGRFRRWLAAAVAAITLVWLALLIPRVIGQVGFQDMFRDVGMATLEIEEGREAIGLLLVAAWMLVLVRAGHRIKRSITPAQTHL